MTTSELDSLSKTCHRLGYVSSCLSVDCRCRKADEGSHSQQFLFLKHSRNYRTLHHVLLVNSDLQVLQYGATLRPCRHRNVCDGKASLCDARLMTWHSENVGVDFYLRKFHESGWATRICHCVSITMMNLERKFNRRHATSAKQLCNTQILWRIPGTSPAFPSLWICTLIRVELLAIPLFRARFCSTSSSLCYNRLPNSYRQLAQSILVAWAELQAFILSTINKIVAEHVGKDRPGQMSKS